MHSSMFSTSKLGLMALLAAQFSTISLGHPVLEQRTSPISMGLARTFGAVAATTITSTGATAVVGDLGTCPGTAIDGFGLGEGICTGSVNRGNTAACNAEAACLTAYNEAAALVTTSTLVSTDLGGVTLGPGVYAFPTLNAALSTTLTLDGSSNPAGQFVFQIRTTFSTSAGTSNIVLVGGAQACNVFFIIGSSATISAGSNLQGNFLAYTSIAVKAAARNNGTFCALNGAVTLINNGILAQPICAA